MKLPEKIKGKTRIRDAAICRDYLDSKLKIEEIADKHKLSQRHIHRIVYKHADVINLNKAHEKLQRIRWLKQQIEKAGDTRKDSLEVYEQFRKEIEGDKALIDQSQNIEINYVFGQEDHHQNTVHPSRISARDPQRPDTL